MIKDDSIYLKHMLESIENIENSIRSISKEEFVKDKDIIDATLRRLEVIGEAVKNISSGFKEKHNEVEWKKIAGMRDVLIHAYFDVDVELVWEIVKKDLPKFNTHIKNMLAEF